MVSYHYLLIITAKIKIVIISNAVRDAEKMELSHISGGKYYSHFENSLTLSYKTKHTLTIRPNNHKLECYSKGNKNLCSYKNLYKYLWRLY